ncbi:hypothetical protein BD410DRAFT_792865 [Rickenella mellea]|uniref:Uncharacterized protein n=1 Tax=Rickenella mellea TaxID=50990 RepID=A0A4Y7PUD3_9AGAM|nr:hypothetical protein BD410DRAFT_792865 [Rickenella mellea]
MKGNVSNWVQSKRRREVRENDEINESKGIAAADDLISGPDHGGSEAGTPSVDSDELVEQSASQSPLNIPTNEEEESEWRPRGKGNKPSSGPKSPTKPPSPTKPKPASGDSKPRPK